MKAILALSLLFAASLLNAQSAVKRVHRVYVDEIHFPTNPDWDGIVRSKLIGSLVQDCGPDCSVIEAAGVNGDNGDDAVDGVLTGTVVVENNGSGRYRIQGAMRLVAKDGTVLWAATVLSSPFARSATSSFADNTARKLTSFLAQKSK